MVFNKEWLKWAFDKLGWILFELLSWGFLIYILVKWCDWSVWGL